MIALRGAAAGCAHARRYDLPLDLCKHRGHFQGDNLQLFNSLLLEERFEEMERERPVAGRSVIIMIVVAVSLSPPSRSIYLFPGVQPTHTASPMSPRTLIRNKCPALRHYILRSKLSLVSGHVCKKKRLWSKKRNPTAKGLE